MKTTMVDRGEGLALRRLPRRLCLLCRGGSGPAVCQRGGCQRLHAPAPRPHPHGRRMLSGQRASGAAAWCGEKPDPGRGQPRLRPPCSGRRAGPLLWPPRHPQPPASSHARHSPQPSVPPGSGPGFPQLPPLSPSGPSSLAPRWAQHPCKPVACFHNSAFNREELGGFPFDEHQPLGYGTAQPMVLAFSWHSCSSFIPSVPQDMAPTSAPQP